MHLRVGHVAERDHTIGIAFVNAMGHGLDQLQISLFIMRSVVAQTMSIHCGGLRVIHGSSYLRIQQNKAMRPNAKDTSIGRRQ